MQVYVLLLDSHQKHWCKVICCSLVNCLRITINVSFIVLYCIGSVHLYSASCIAHQSEAPPVQETQREESRGHPFMTSTRRGRGSGSDGRMWTRGEGGQPHVDVHTEN